MGFPQELSPSDNYMAIVFDNKFEIGDTVYLKTDRDQLARIVYCFIVFRGEVLYKLASGTTISEHYDFELSDTKNLVDAI